MKIPKIVIAIWILYTIISMFPAYNNVKNGYRREKIERCNKIVEEIEYLKSLRRLEIDTLSPISNKFELCNDQLAFDFLEAEAFLDDKEINVASGQINRVIIDSFLLKFDTWPNGYKKIFRENIVKIFIVSGTGYLASTYEIRPGKFVIFLDDISFTEKPNKQIFKNCLMDENVKLYEIEEDSVSGSNSVIACFENTMIHELGHCVGSLFNVTPYLNHIVPTNDFFPFLDTLFVTEVKFHTTYKRFFNFTRSELNGNKWTTNQLYDNLEVYEKSDFPSLYSVKNPYEFFAEYFYLYFHQIVQKKPFYYELYIDGELKRRFDNQLITKQNTQFMKTIQKINEFLK
ncbi:MAG: hypothetical protein SFY32_14375 [Bacteroidota bacterium]|nr:hypothetical protein [Bacteroidota bacterium]